MGQLDDQLWYFLRLASFEREITAFDEVGATYSLSDLRTKLMNLGKGKFMRDDCTDEVNAARYARILFFIGMFNEGLTELEFADYLVEASMMAVVL